MRFRAGFRPDFCRGSAISALPRQKSGQNPARKHKDRPREPKNNSRDTSGLPGRIRRLYDLPPHSGHLSHQSGRLGCAVCRPPRGTQPGHLPKPQPRNPRARAAKRSLFFMCELTHKTGYLEAVWQKNFGPVFLGFRPNIDPGTPLDRRGPPRTSICKKNQARRPILRSFRGTPKIPPDCL